MHFNSKTINKNDLSELAWNIYQDDILKKDDYKIVLSVISHESWFDEKAIGPCGEKGIGQFMKATIKGECKKNGIEYIENIEVNPYFAYMMVSYHIADLIEHYNGDYQLTLLAYNMGKPQVDYDLRIGMNVNQIKYSTYGNKIAYDDRVGNEYAKIQGVI